jgi:transcriptional regulator with PAS, ATPase and Fis domain
MHSLQGPRNANSDYSDPRSLLELARRLWITADEGEILPGARKSPAVSQTANEQVQLIEAMFASTTIGVGIFDAQLRFEKFNAALAVMNGIPSEALRGQSVLDVLGDAAGHIEPIFRQVINTGKPLLGADRSFKIATRTEVRRWVTDFFPLKNIEGKVVKVAVVVVEMTEDKSKPSDAIWPEGGARVDRYNEIAGESAALRQALTNAKTVAAGDATVLLLGENGTGKEPMARAIHRMSARHERSFLAVNCASVPAGLLDSELFGHEQGAFTGAVQQRIGQLESANHGTLFLDEIDEMPLALQAKLLHTLETHEFARLGGTDVTHIDVRFIAATDEDLAQRVAGGTFRSDLYYRLNVFAILMPALRDRKEDIPLLAHYFARKHARRLHKKIDAIDPSMMNTLLKYDWPGNIRELENLMERAVILSSGPLLQATVGL